MSTAFQGSYTSDLYNASKRYRIYNQKGVPLADSELREIQSVSDSFVRELVANNFPRGSSTNDGFKVIESGSPANNFTVKGGDGTVNGAGVLFVDGYILFIKSATGIEYNQQDATGALTDDDYTKTTIPPLTTPGGARTDEVYVDFYFAEVSAVSGSEYTDVSLIVSGIGSATANRIRQVQDIRVVEGGTTPADYTDGNGIAHKCVKIATLARTATVNINTAMITDNRVLVNSNYSYMNGTAKSIMLENGASIGNDTHRLSSIYMASTIDYKTNDLMFKNNGTERVRITTAGSIGIGTTNPITTLDVRGGVTTGSLDINNFVASNSKQFNFGIDESGDYSFIYSIHQGVAYTPIVLQNIGNGKVGIGTTNPQSKLHVQGDCLISNNLTVNGTTTTVNTESTVTDMMVINQDDNQVAFQVNQTLAGNTAAVMQVTNSGTGPAATFVGIGTGTAKVGIGTDNPIKTFEVQSASCMGRFTSTTGTNEVVGAFANTGGNLWIGRESSVGGAFLTGSSAYAGVINVTGAYPLQIGTNNVVRMTISSSGLVGIGTTPSDWNSGYSRVIQLNPATSIASVTAGSIFMNNAYYSSGGQYIYLSNNAASMYYMAGNQHLWKTAPTGNAGDPLTWSTGMIIDPNGNVGISTDNPSGVLHIQSANSTTLNLDRIAATYGGKVQFSRNGTCEWSIQTSSQGTGEGSLAWVNAGISTAFLINQTGYVGIGTVNPLSSLHIRNGNILITDYTDSTVRQIQFTPSDNGVRSSIQGFSGSVPANDYLRMECRYGTLRFATDTSGTPTERMRITSAGNVGIGTANPANLLISWDTTSNGHPIVGHADNAAFASTAITASTKTAAGTGFNLFEGVSNSATVFKVRGDGQIYSDAGTSVSSPADFAEWTKVVGDVEDYEVGTIVQQSDEDLTVEEATDSESVYGIVTDRATFCGGLTEAFEDIEIKKDFMVLQVEELEEKYNAKRIAMTGHVICKVTGTIKKGQRLTLSDVSGVAKAATTFEEKALAFAIARQDYDEEDVGLIEIRLL